MYVHSLIYSKLYIFRMVNQCEALVVVYHKYLSVHVTTKGRSGSKILWLHNYFELEILVGISSLPRSMIMATLL